MARINSYPTERPVQDDDAWIGSTYPGGKTRQFRADDVAKYLNIKGKISISGQMVFRFTSNMASGSITGVADGTAFSAITSLNISNKDSFGQDVTDFLPYLVGSDLLISEQNNISEFGHYKITSYTPDLNDPFAVIVLDYIGGNGSLELLKYYDVANFVLASESEDKNFVFTQGVPSTTWTIQHNLNKFPSVTSVNNNDVQMFGEVTYIDENNLIINFSAGFSGKAYIN